MSFGTIPWHSDLENCRDLQQFDEFYNVLFCFFGNTRQTGKVPSLMVLQAWCQTNIMIFFILSLTCRAILYAYVKACAEVPNQTWRIAATYSNLTCFTTFCSVSLATRAKQEKCLLLWCFRPKVISSILTKLEMAKDIRFQM